MQDVFRDLLSAEGFACHEGLGVVRFGASLLVRRTARQCWFALPLHSLNALRHSVDVKSCWSTNPQVCSQAKDKSSIKKTRPREDMGRSAMQPTLKLLVSLLLTQVAARHTSLLLGVSVAIVWLGSPSVFGGVRPQVPHPLVLALHLIGGTLLCGACRPGLVLVIPGGHLARPAVPPHHLACTRTCCKGAIQMSIGSQLYVEDDVMLQE